MIRTTNTIIDGVLLPKVKYLIKYTLLQYARTSYILNYLRCAPDRSSPGNRSNKEINGISQQTQHTKIKSRLYFGLDQFQQWRCHLICKYQICCIPYEPFSAGGPQWIRKCSIPCAIGCASMIESLPSNIRCFHYLPFQHGYV